MILAGVSINTVLGDDGIIKKAKEVFGSHTVYSEDTSELEKNLSGSMNLGRKNSNDLLRYYEEH